jgi:serine O-acetyltransferase
MSFLTYITSDLYQARVLTKYQKLKVMQFLYYFLRSRTCRIQTFIRLRSRGKFLSYIAKKYLDRYFIEIGANTVIGKFFWLPHPRCIIIADSVIIGEHVHVAQYVTIGGNFKKNKRQGNGDIQKLPIIGNRVMIHPSAVIGGPVTIHSDIIIGANAVITKDIPSNSMAFGLNKIASKKIRIPCKGGEFEQL